MYNLTFGTDTKDSYGNGDTQTVQLLDVRRSTVRFPAIEWNVLSPKKQPEGLWRKAVDV
jgi:hypothetical protein